MVERVDQQLVGLIDRRQGGAWRYHHAMGGLRAVGILRMLNGSHVADILTHPAAKGGGQRLDAATDAQHRYLTVISQTGDEQLRQIALLIDTMEFG